MGNDKIQGKISDMTLINDFIRIKHGIEDGKDMTKDIAESKLSHESKRKLVKLLQERLDEIKESEYKNEYEGYRDYIENTPSKFEELRKKKISSKPKRKTIKCSCKKK